MGKLKVNIIDFTSGDTVAAKAQVLSSSGQFLHPIESVSKVGTGDPFFYSDGVFELDVASGPTRITIERGTEYSPKVINVDIPASGLKSIDVEIERWNDLPENGWHPGNTHIHYDEKEKNPDKRLYLDPRVEDLRMTAISILKRWDLEYATNKYPVGFLNEYSSEHHYVQNGEESRHNKAPWDIGYGHIMLLDIKNVVEPLSRGLLVDAFEADYPPLSYACDDAHRQGATVIWCHNGQGMEAPVAAILGKVDAFNLFDPNWTDVEYKIYYEMLNAGIKMPASTGSDWYICSANRVYSQSQKKFDYGSWLDSFRSGKTFITNGPALFFTVDDAGPGTTIRTDPGRMLSAHLSWKSHYRVQSIEVVKNGVVIYSDKFPDGKTEGDVRLDVEATDDSWMAARLFSDVRDSYLQPQFAHTSPIYIETGNISPEFIESSKKFHRSIEKSLDWIGNKGRFYSNKQRKEIQDLYLEGASIYLQQSKLGR